MGRRKIKVRKNKRTYSATEQRDIVFAAEQEKAIQLVRQHFMVDARGQVFEYKAMRHEDMPPTPYRYLYHVTDDAAFDAWNCVMAARARVIEQDDYPHVWTLRLPFHVAEIPSLLAHLLKQYPRQRAAEMLLKAIMDADAKRGGKTYAEQSPKSFRMLQEIASPEDAGKHARLYAAMPDFSETGLADSGDYRDTLHERAGRDALVEDVMRQAVEREKPLPRPGEILFIDANDEQVLTGVMTLSQFEAIQQGMGADMNNPTLRDVRKIVEGGSAAYWMSFSVNGEGQAAAGSIATFYPGDSAAAN